MFRRFASDEANSSAEKSSVESADSDNHGAVRSAIDSATESASTYAGNAAENLTENAERAKDAVADGAAATAASLGFSHREHRRDPRPSYNDRNGDRLSYGDRRLGGDRTSYGNRGGYGGDRDGGRSIDKSFDRDSRGPRSGYREPAALTPCPNIYIGNLLFDVTASDLEREFGEFGTVKSAIVASDARGLSKG